VLEALEQTERTAEHRRRHQTIVHPVGAIERQGARSTHRRGNPTAKSVTTNV
jgi:hypothetical protein